MAMSLPISIPTTASPVSSDDNSIQPRTPVSPGAFPLPDQSKMNMPQLSSATGAAPVKRKANRRANTAERRATHNAVERQRRETLNGRFLDLAALLPNLSQIRRPSKSSIVNSSIAHIHASRRHRQLASRELRLLKLESDAMRRELNEWRDRASLPHVEEPVRSEGFAMILSGEPEVLAAIPDEEEEAGAQGLDSYDDGEDDFTGMTGPNVDDFETQMFNTNLFAHNLPPPANNPPVQMMARSSHGPMIVSNPPTVSFENPAIASIYEPNYHTNSQYAGSHYLQHPQSDIDKVVAWNAHLYTLANGTSPSQQLMQAQRSLFTPPSSSHGLPTSGTTTAAGAQHQSNSFSDPASQAFLVNFQRQQQQQQQIPTIPLGHIFASPEVDDASSIGSVHARRERSGSLSGSASGYGSPTHGSSPGNYDMPTGDFSMPRGTSTGAQLSNSGSWVSETDGIGGLDIMQPVISVGGGGNGTGFAMMM
jgi:hypothetical protein